MMDLFLELRAKRIIKAFNTRSVYLRHVLGFVPPMFFLGFLCLIQQIDNLPCKCVQACLVCALHPEPSEFVLGLDSDHQNLCLFYGTHDVSCIFVAKANVDLTNKH